MINNAIQNLLKFYDRFSKNKKGNVAIIFGVSTIPLFALSLGLLQHGEALNIKRAMCNSADAAVLLAASNPDQELVRLQGEADHLFKQDFGKYIDKLTGLEINLNYLADRDSYTYTASGSMPTPLYSLINIDSMSISCGAEATPERNGVEIVFALDTTGSMGFGSSWEDATEAMATILPGMRSMTNSDEFFVSFFPFSDRVNLGKSQDIWNNWLGNKTILAEIDGTPKDLDYDDWNGCVQPRPENPVANDWRLDDDSPATKPFIPSHRELAFDASDPDLGTGGLANASGGWKDNAPHCNGQPILGPTNDPTTIMSAIEGISLTGTGRFDVGLAWAWRMISPKWQGLWDVASGGYFGYPSEYGERRKVVVFITDAYTEGYRWEVCDSNGQGNCAVLGSNQGSVKGFENMVDVCTKMKNNGIEIHTIYVNGNNHGVPYLQQCATNVGNYYHEVSDVTELTVALDKIKATLSNVRLTQ